MSGAATFEAPLADSGPPPRPFANRQQSSNARREVYPDLVMCGQPQFKADRGGFASELIARGCFHRWATLGSWRG